MRLISPIVIGAWLLHKYLAPVELGPLEPVDLHGKTFLVTGATSGLGQWHAETLAAWNASLVLPVRDLKAGRAFADTLAEAYPNAPRAVVEQMDLNSLASVRAFADKYKGPVDVLVHNAATLGSGELRRTEDGFEECFQVNYLSTFLLTSLMLNRLESSSAGRIVHVSAKAHEWAKINLTAMRDEKVLGPDFTSRQGRFMGNLGGSYADSKLAQIHFSAALNRRLEGGTVSISLHPAITTTRLLRDEVMNPVTNFFMQKIVMRIGQGVGFMQNRADAPKTQIHVSTHPSLQVEPAQYYSALSPPLINCGKNAETCGVSTVSKAAADETLQEEMFKISCELLGLTEGLCSRET